MAEIKPFKGIRPPRELAHKVASRPYDVLNSDEAREEAKGNECSLLRIIKPEIEFSRGTDEHGAEVYDKAVENFKLFQEKGWLVKDQKDCLYIYAQTMNGRTQYGLVAAASVDDYLNGVIKKLGNESFVNNAPDKVVDLERKKKADAEEKIKARCAEMDTDKGPTGDFDD